MSTFPSAPRAQQGQEDGPRWLRDIQAWMEKVKLFQSARFYEGAGSPETVVAARIGAIYTRTDGGASTTLYVKESGTGNTGWVAK